MKRHFWEFVTYFCQYSNLKQRRFILTRSQSIPFVQVLQIVTLPVSKSRNFILCAQFISRGYKLGMLKMYFLTRKIHSQPNRCEYLEWFGIPCEKSLQEWTLVSNECMMLKVNVTFAIMFYLFVQILQPYLQMWGYSTMLYSHIKCLMRIIC